MKKLILLIACFFPLFVYADKNFQVTFDNELLDLKEPAVEGNEPQAEILLAGDYPDLTDLSQEDIERHDLQAAKTLGQLFVAARSGNTFQLEQLHRAGVDMNLTNAYGETALMAVIAQARDNFMSTVWRFASQFPLLGHPGRVIDTLIELGADVNFQVKSDGETPLMRLVRPPYYKSYGSIIRKFHAQGADLEATNKNGETAWMIAFKNRNKWAVETLNELGAEPQLTITEQIKYRYQRTLQRVQHACTLVYRY